MSRTSSFLTNLLHEIPSADHFISLVDTTKPTESSFSPHDGDIDAERNGSADTAVPTPSSENPLLKRLTNNSLSLQQTLRQQIARQKYARYGRDRYEQDSSDDRTNASSSGQRQAEQSSATQSAPRTEGDAADAALSTPAQIASYIDRGRARAKTLLKRKRKLGRGHETEDRVLDVLYENQRGWFLFGTPRYSAATLLPCDPRPWQNGDFRTSPVDIRNAQVPDPGWEWAWKSWYVDMSHDVDEEGWEYSAFFRVGFNWHGNHPWASSWVRRRRWVRLRRRKECRHVTKEKSHELNAEYFTIHPRTVFPGSEEGGRHLRSASSSELAARDHAFAATWVNDDADGEKVEISDVGSLVRALRRATVDREKLVALHQFVTHAGDELYYLSQRMPEIMGLFVYQSSRRQLLADLMSHHDIAHAKRVELADYDQSVNKDDEKRKVDHDTAARHAEYLHAAILAADEQVKKLEYWSDIKGMAQDGDLLPSSSERWKQASGAGESGHPVDAFASKQKADDGIQKLHRHPEHIPNEPAGGETPGRRSQESRQHFFDATTSPPSERGSKRSHGTGGRAISERALGRSPDSSESGASAVSEELDRYTTADESIAESSSTFDREGPASRMISPAQKGKEKAIKLGGLDGMMEEGEEKSTSPNDIAEDQKDGSPRYEARLTLMTPRSEEGDILERENA